MTTKAGWEDIDSGILGDDSKELLEHECKCADGLTMDPMLPAGTLLHLIPIGGATADKTSKISSKTQYIIKNIEVEDDGELYEILISSKMVTDHMPMKYVKSLRFCNENITVTA